MTEVKNTYERNEKKQCYGYSSVIEKLPPKSQTIMTVTETSELFSTDEQIQCSAMSLK